MTIKECRTMAGLTCTQVAAMMGIPVLKYKKYENDASKMSIIEAKLFSRIVGVDYDDIFFARYSI